MTIAKFTIADAHGKNHLYEIAPHPPDEGMDILWVLIGLGGEPLARLAQSTIADALQGLGESGEKPVTKGKDGKFKLSLAASSIMDKIDLEKVDFVGAAKDIRMAMATMPMSELVHKLLRYTLRDGKGLDIRTDNGRLNFDRAFTANYIEMMQAVWRVIANNGFLPQLVTSALG